MPGISYVQPEARYSASSWYTNVDATHMGIQSTAQFVDKYHHIIGKQTKRDEIYVWSEEARGSQELG